MRAKSAYLQEEVGLHACYGRGFEKRDEDCVECHLQGDCESLSQLRKERRRTHVAKKPKQKVTVYEYENEEEEETVPWSTSDEEEVDEEMEGTASPEQPYQNIWWPQHGYWQPPPLPPSGKKKKGVQVPAGYQVPQFYPHLMPGYPPPSNFHMPPYPIHPMHPQLPPGAYNMASPVIHPTHPHLNYIVGSPIECPMPYPDEPWGVRLLKNMAAEMLSAGGLMAFKFFRDWKFPKRG